MLFYIELLIQNLELIFFLLKFKKSIEILRVCQIVRKRYQDVFRIFAKTCYFILEKNV
jgi:hypothetical protein